MEWGSEGGRDGAARGLTGIYRSFIIISTSIVIFILIMKASTPTNCEWRPMAPAVGTTVTMTIVFFPV